MAPYRSGSRKKRSWGKEGGSGEKERRRKGLLPHRIKKSTGKERRDPGGGEEKASKGKWSRIVLGNGTDGEAKGGEQKEAQHFLL